MPFKTLGISILNPYTWVFVNMFNTTKKPVFKTQHKFVGGRFFPVVQWSFLLHPAPTLLAMTFLLTQTILHTKLQYIQLFVLSLCTTENLCMDIKLDCQKCIKHHKPLSPF